MARKFGHERALLPQLVAEEAQKEKQAGRQRRDYSAGITSKVVLTASRGNRPAELAQQFDVRPNQITTWKQELLK